MTGSWKAIKLKDVCSIDKAKHLGKLLPYVGLEHIESGTGKFLGVHSPLKVKSSTFRFGPQHLLYGRLRPYLNKVLLPDFEAHCSSEIFPLKVAKELDRRFLFYWITWQPIVNKIDKTSTGARMPRANVTKVLEFDFLLPPLPEQKSIVAILDEAFTGIETAIANTEKNLANARALFESYLNAVFSSGAEEWPEQRFGDVCEFVRGPFGGSLKKSCFVKEGLAVYEQQHAISDRFSDVRYFVDQEKFKEMSRFELKPGDLIMSCSGTMGRVAVAPKNLARGIINQALLKLTPGSDIDAEFLKLWMESEAFIGEIGKHSKGVAIKNVASVKVLKEIRVPTPPKDVQKTVVGKLIQCRGQSRELEAIYKQKLAALEELKQSLLQRAFSGELMTDAVDEAQKAVA